MANVAQYYLIPNTSDAYRIDVFNGVVESRYTPARDGGPWRWVIGNASDWHPLIGGIDDQGYPHVGLRVNGRPKTIKIHTLVLEAVAGPCPPGLEACHNDGNKRNNCYLNLRWDTPESNWNDRRLHGVNIKPGAKLNWEKVRELRAKWATSRYLQRELGEQYGLSQRGVSLIVNNETWIE